MLARSANPALGFDTDAETLDVPFEIKELKADEDDQDRGTFTGMASTFGNIDEVGDIILPGAFKGAIKNPRKIRMLWQHRSDTPIGTWEDLRETEKGLEAKGRLILGVQQGREAFELMRARAVDALSIGFRIGNRERDIDFDRETGVRRLKRIDLMEISVVTFPANPKARIQRVKSLNADTIKTIRDFEAFLRDVGGFSHGAAKQIASQGFKAEPDPRDEAGLEKLAAALKRNTAALS